MNPNEVKNYIYGKNLLLCANKKGFRSENSLKSYCC